jgi:GH25 family lysozyme M1 (1,4-beta-N-acetylmuramidase)
VLSSATTARVTALVLLATACHPAVEDRPRPAPSAAPDIPTITVSAPPPPAPPSAAPEATAPCENLGAARPEKKALGTLGGMRGADVSTPAPWKDLAARGITFAFAQAARGARPNGSFRDNWAMMKRCGFARGAYHLLAPGAGGDEEARVFLDQLGGDPGELPPVVDVERSGRCEGACCKLSCAAWSARVRAWIDGVAAATKRTPAIYTMRSFWMDCLCGTKAFREHPLWLAREEGDAPGREAGFGGWARWTFLQHAQNVRFGGTLIDLDDFRGSREDLAALAAER